MEIEDFPDKCLVTEEVTKKEENTQKISFFEIKKKLILKEFINILKNIN